ncbi:Glucoamylase [Psilocybe cubensis]|uniref:Glucoamylase n=1 Tax=Psilocybe cubensis TaxID=181762 RepID=A0ACB8GZE3_PSICU|nr:Glucoamylase [Psilocybe cubensis]KAH9480596.1 Glucoamylase [Psilocybe cubensis]
MRFYLLTSLCCISAVIAQSSVVEKYIATQGPIAKAGLLANIGPDGSKSSGAKAHPYFLPILKALQQVTNPSGTVSTGGLGEPKFNIDGSAFTGSWGRPQRDGPALRATALTTYAEWLIKTSNSSFVKSKIWPVLKLDLDYTATFWNASAFDLWEEVSSSSYFTSAAQHRALREGAELAAKIGQKSVVAEYRKQADNILCFLQTYWNPVSGYVTANTRGGRSGIDANTILASIHNFDPEAGCDANTLQPCSDKALSNLKVYVDAFRTEYAINKGIPATSAVATGRYTEDVYYDGNPWYLTTAAVAEQLYDALIVWKKQSSLTVTPTSLAFFRQFSPSVKQGTYRSSSSTYTTLVKAVKDFADGFIAVNAKYTPSNGALAEQFDRNTGVPASAADLTWSYAATLTAFAARRGAIPASWGAKGLKVPTVCKPNPGPTVQVTFNVIATTVDGENIFITGSIDALEGWSPDTALPLSPANYPTWSITLTLPANTNFEYKYIRKINGAVTWQSDPNNIQSTPANGTLVTHDSWR